jgi:hypothetical protein
LLLIYSAELLDDYTYDLTFDKLRLYFIPRVFLVDISRFFSGKSTPKEGEAKEELRAGDELATSNESETTSATPEKSESAREPPPPVGPNGERINSVTRWRVKVREPEICLLRDENDRRTSGVVVSAAIDFVSTDSSQRFELIEAVRANRESESNPGASSTEASSTNPLLPLSDATTQLKYELMLKNLRVYSCQFDCEKQSTVSIVQPWTLYAHQYVSFPRSVPIESNGGGYRSGGVTNALHQLLSSHVKSFPIQAMFSCQDVLLISDIVKRINGVTDSQSTSSSNNNNNNNNTSPSRGVRSPRRSGDESLSSSPGTSTPQRPSSASLPSHHHYHAARGKSGVAPPIVPRRANASSRLKEEAEVISTHMLVATLHGMECTFIDDSYDQNLPLLRLNLTTAEVKGEFGANSRNSHASSTHVRAKLNVELLYYASSHGIWESVLLPWNVLASYRENSLLLPGVGPNGNSTVSAPNRTRDVLVRAHAALDLTVTKPFVDTILRSHKVWEREYTAHVLQREAMAATGTDMPSPSAISAMTAKSTGDRPPFAPFVIRNLTGVDVQYQVNR